MLQIGLCDAGSEVYVLQFYSEGGVGLKNKYIGSNFQLSLTISRDRSELNFK